MTTPGATAPMCDHVLGQDEDGALDSTCVRCGADMFQSDRDCSRCSHPVRQHDGNGCMYPGWKKHDEDTCYCPSTYSDSATNGETGGDRRG